MKYKLVHISWFDAISTDDWMMADDIEEALPEIQTVGYLIRETETLFIVAQNVDFKNDSISMTMTIPKVWCVKMREI